MVPNGGATLIYTRAWHFRDCMNYSLVFVFSNGSVIISVPEEGVLFLPSLPLPPKKNLLSARYVKNDEEQRILWGLKSRQNHLVGSRP